MRIRLLCCITGLLGAALSPTLVRAQDALARVRERGTLVWGADQEGGGPFVFPRADDPTQIQGFEVEIAAYLAERLGVTAQFSQGQWDKLPDLLDRGDIDIVLNGYEWSPSRADRYGVSLPYYIYELQLLGRRKDRTLTQWSDLSRDGERKRIAVLGGSAANDYIVQHYGEQVDVVNFDGATDAMRAVELDVDGIDANLQDLPVAIYYSDGFPGLTFVGEPVGRGYYVILTRKEDAALLAALNDAIIAGLRDGTLREIYERYGIWNETQERRGLETDSSGEFVGPRLPEAGADGDAAAQPREYVALRGWDVIAQRGGLLLKATGMTVLLSVASMPLAILIGLGLALSRLYGPALLRWPATLYVEVVRGTPLVLQLYVIFFLLPEIGVSIHAFWAAVMGLAINYSAYEAEIYRAGLQAIPRGQMEAALSLGMTRGLALRRVIVPQATRIVIPPVTNDFIALFKDTAVCSVITVVELSKAYYIHARDTGAVIELGVLTCFLYLALSYPLSLVAGMLERRLNAPAQR